MCSSSVWISSRLNDGIVFHNETTSFSLFHFQLNVLLFSHCYNYDEDEDGDDDDDYDDDGDYYSCI